MSHVTLAKVVVKDLDALAKAAKRCGCELVIGQKNYKWYGRWVNDYSANDAAYRNGIKVEDYGKCEHAVRVTGGNDRTYELGVVKNPNGEGFVFVYDNYCGGYGLEDRIGIGSSVLEKYYNAEATKNAMESEGFTIVNEWEENGIVHQEFEELSY